MCRKGLVDAPFLLLLAKFTGIMGIVCAPTIIDIIGVAAGLILCQSIKRKIPDNPALDRSQHFVV